MNPLETYLSNLGAIGRPGAGTAETSYYGALEALLNAVGDTLKPKVRCVLQVRNQGAGFPDGGLFTADQEAPASADAAPLLGLVPARGVVEVKPAAEDLDATCRSDQVRKYLRRYRQVLVANFREFRLMALDERGRPVALERFTLAADEAAFHEAQAHPRRTAQADGARLVDYLTRVMRRPAPLADPEDVAWFLASYAREALARVEAVHNLPALAAVRTALEEALGLTFEDQKGEHFFRSSLVQTLFYGIFSGWVLWSKDHAPATRARFNWHEAAWYLHVPMIRTLFQQVATPEQLGRLGLVEILDWAADALNRVDRAAFFSRFEEGRAVQYFYEPFLKAFDPQLRKSLGVWYTPPEIVQYMVARVDTVLREELGMADGLADPNVYILDPCCGTGAYLVEVLRRIAATLREKGGDALTAHALKRAAMERVFGFEILPAPFVVAHLQLGLFLQSLGAPLADERERAGIYLTNALTGWEPPKEPKTRLLFPELEEERDAAEKVKREVPILVILGNPPYSGFAGVAMGEERDLSTAYRTTTRAPKPQGQGLNDLYVRFFRMAERRIVERTGRGVVCFISNYSWLDGLSFTGMRERYLDAFDRIWIDCLNGDKYKTGKLTPWGDPDPSVFSTETSPVGIQVGTAIALFVHRREHEETEAVQFRHLWGVTKRQQLVQTAHQDGVSLYEKLAPPLELGLPFMPGQVAPGYLSWPALPDLFPTYFPGVKTSRDEFVVDIDRERLIQRMRQYCDADVSHQQMGTVCPFVMQPVGSFKPERVRSRLQKRGFSEENVIRYCYRPFDLRWLYWEPESGLLDRPRLDFLRQVFVGNLFLEARQRQPKERFDRGYPVRLLADNFGNGLSQFFPLFVRKDGRKSLLLDFASSQEDEPNTSEQTSVYLDATGGEPAMLFDHVFAVLHSQDFRRDNNTALRQDWPRIPLPADRERLAASAELGRRVAALLDVETDVPGVTSGRIRGELKRIAVISHVEGKALDPNAGDLDVTVGWGHAGQRGVTMPGQGRAVEREYEPSETSEVFRDFGSLSSNHKTSGVAENSRSLLGETTVDIYLNDVAYWKNVPKRVWEYTLGGYQVIKKWLSYRERDLLGRALKPEEARYVTEMARRIAAILLLEPELDANYQAVKADTYPWPRMGGGAAT